MNPKMLELFRSSWTRAACCLVAQRTIPEWTCTKNPSKSDWSLHWIKQKYLKSKTYCWKATDVVCWGKARSLEKVADSECLSSTELMQMTVASENAYTSLIDPEALNCGFTVLSNDLLLPFRVWTVCRTLNTSKHILSFAQPMYQDIYTPHGAVFGSDKAWINYSGVKWHRNC